MYNISKISKQYVLTYLVAISVVMGVGQKVSSKNTEFITSTGNFLTIGTESKPWFFVGANNYYIGIDNNSQSTVDELMADMVQMNLGVLRIWGFNDDQNKTTKLQGPNAGDFLEANFQMLDYVLYQADRHDIRIILPLTNYWNDYGGMRQYVQWTGDTTPTADEFYGISQAQTYFRNFISHLANRVNTYNQRIYKEDPTILAWQLANEPEYPTDTNTANGSILTDWINNTADYLKNTIGVKQLVTTGMEGFYDSGNSSKGGQSWFDNKGTDFIIQHAGSGIDLTGFHIYADHWNLTQVQCEKWIVNHIRDARRHSQLGKPVIMDEYGRMVPQHTMAERNDSFIRYLHTAYRELVSGTNFWILYHDAYPNYDNFGVYYPQDQETASILIQHAKKINFLNETGIHQLFSFEEDEEGFTKIYTEGGIIDLIERREEPSWNRTADGVLCIQCRLGSPGDKAMVGAEIKDPLNGTAGINVSDYGYRTLLMRVRVQANSMYNNGDIDIKMYDKTGSEWLYHSSPVTSIVAADRWYEIPWNTVESGNLADLKELGIDIYANHPFDGAVYIDFVGGDITDTTDNSLATVNLKDVDSGTTSPQGNYRWLDIADQVYDPSYQADYEYTQADVQVTFHHDERLLYGILTARNLKPNFAYQCKLAGLPETDPNANENIGLTGRWWQEEWSSAAQTWINGQNLNNKGDGSSPNPNDLAYFSRKDIPDPNSPTGKKYRYSGYLVFDYFITDEWGNTVLSFEADSSYHVLWKTTQRSRSSDDGPVKSHTFDPTINSPAYNVDYPPSTVQIFGEWERLPIGGVRLPIGSYRAQFILTEESFHGSGLAGGWAAAVGAPVTFTILPAIFHSDLNYDGYVDLFDFSALAEAWQAGQGDPQWNPLCDINEPSDNIVNQLDLQVFLVEWLSRQP